MNINVAIARRPEDKAMVYVTCTVGETAYDGETGYGGATYDHEPLPLEPGSAISPCTNINSSLLSSWLNI